MIKMSIRADAARLATTCMAKRDIRYYLMGIHVEPRPEGGAFVVGTDGHRMIAVIDSEAECSEPVTLTIPPALLSKLPRMGIDKPKQRLELDEFRGKPALVLTDSSSGVLPDYISPNPMIEASRYPDWKRVMPDFDRLQRWTGDPFKVDYLTSVLAGFKPDRFRPFVAIPYQAQPQGAVLFHFSGFEHVALIIMPLRTNEESLKLAGLRKNFGKPVEILTPPETAIA